jgi:hypothetical protein
MAVLGRPKRVVESKTELTAEEASIVGDFGDALSQHRKTLSKLDPKQKIKYFADAVYYRQNFNNPAVTAVPLKPFLWMLLRSGLIKQDKVVDGLVKIGKFYSEGEDAQLLLPETLYVGAKRHRAIQTNKFIENIMFGKLDILDYDKLFRLGVERNKQNLKDLTLGLYQELMLQNRVLRKISLVPQERVVMGANRAFYLGWYDDSVKKTPYMYLLLDVAAFTLVAEQWVEEAQVDWLKKAEDRKFVVDSGDKVGVLDYVLPMCLASVDAFAKDSDSITKRSIAQFISGARKQ